MKQYKDFIQENLLQEGGNVNIDGIGADRINLNHTNRTEITDSLAVGLERINKKFKTQFGISLWNQKLFDSKMFLSGSAFHFFDRHIPDERFKKFKPTVGDIDTQVDANMSAQIKEFLTGFSGSAGPLEYIGFKSSSGQYITLWKEKKTGLNIQIDMELVDFQGNEPTEWSQFSHSADWGDIEAGIKGVFHKYILRSLTAKGLKDAIVLTGKTKKPKRMKAKELAFSVMRGLRKKIAPVMTNGEQVYRDGLPVYEEIPTNESSYITDIRTIFSMLFGYTPQTKEVQQFQSFIGILDIVKKNYSGSEVKELIKNYGDILWGKSSQKLVRDNGNEDYAIKMTSFQKLLDTVNQKEPKSVSLMRAEYYRNY